MVQYLMPLGNNGCYAVECKAGPVNHALPVSALIGSNQSNDHMACPEDNFVCTEYRDYARPFLSRSEHKRLGRRLLCTRMNLCRTLGQKWGGGGADATQ